MKFSVNMMKKQKYAIAGIGSTFNLAGASMERVRVGDASDDIKALRNDWAAVGNDIRWASGALKRSSESKVNRDDSKRPAR
jgi:hypothetical protein